MREEQVESDRSVECQPFGAGPRPSLAAIFTRSARESAFIFRITLCLDRDLADAEVATDLFIQQAGHDPRHDLPFARVSEA
jgi:hypothetical protein